MHKQLVLLHNAVAAYFSGNAAALEGTIKQFNVKVPQNLKIAHQMNNHVNCSVTAKITKFSDRFMA